MDTIYISDLKFKRLITSKEINEAVEKVANQLNDDYKDCPEPPVIISVLSGAFIFTADLVRKLNFDFNLGFIKPSSYVGTQSSNKIRMEIPLTIPIKDRDVIIVEDIVDTGNTMAYVTELFKTEEKAKSVNICCICYKPEKCRKDVIVKYPAMDIPKNFIVGYGLDYNQYGRGYKDIYALED